MGMRPWGYLQAGARGGGARGGGEWEGGEGGLCGGGGGAAGVRDARIYPHGLIPMTAFLRTPTSIACTIMVGTVRSE